MRNLNVNLAANAANTLLVESTCTTPCTPEILNSLIAMTSPLDNYNFNNNNNNSAGNNGIKNCAKPPTNLSSDSNSSSSSQVESPTNNPPSVQHTCSQLIKAGLKLSIEQKRKHQSDGEDLLDLDKCKRIKKNECSESEEDKHKQEGNQNWMWYESDEFKLTPEDEERRRRRRERNKIAATKCRLKKRERTANLVNESETLETQNVDLKTQLQELQNQKRSLLETLTLHRPHCQHNITPANRDNLYLIPSGPVSSILDNHSYSRPSSVNSANGFCAQAHDVYSANRSGNAAVSNNIAFNSRAPSGNYAKPPSIIIEDISDTYQPQLTNLDNVVVSNTYYNTQCHNYSSNQNSYSTNSGMDNGCMA